ncbi:MAG: hypothetical protein GXP43_03355 [bacterium]|nr:hypothetical protein [bacterium]
MESLLSKLRLVVGIDLGSVNSAFVLPGRIFQFPSVVAYKKKNKELVAVGQEARLMWGKVPSQLEVVTPITRSRIMDDGSAFALIDYALNETGWGGVGWFLGQFYSQAAVVVSPCLNSVERKVFLDVVSRLGVGRVRLVDKVLVSLVGMGWDVFSPVGRMVVYIGGGVSHLSLVSLGGKVIEESLEFGGWDVSNSLIDYVRRRYDVVMSFNEAERLKKTKFDEVGSKIRIRGFSVAKKKMTMLKLPVAEVREVLLGSYSQVMMSLKRMMEKLPSEFLPEVNKQGLVLIGGGGWLDGFQSVLVEELGVPVKCERGEDVVAKGLQKILRDEEKLNRLQVGL